MVPYTAANCVKIKLTLFRDNPPAIVGKYELAAAAGMAYSQAGLALPDIAEGDPAQVMCEKINAWDEATRKRPDPKLITLIGTAGKGDTVDEDFIKTMQEAYRLCPELLPVRREN